MSNSVAGSPPSRLYERIGKTDGVSRSISMSRFAGRSLRAWLTRACTCCSATIMSVDGENVTFVSLPPRIDRDCTRVTPGMMLIASSIGRVMLNSTWRAPSELPFDDDRDARKFELRIDRGRQTRCRPDAGAAQDGDREIDESSLLREKPEERALLGHGFHGFSGLRGVA